jgi:hypothetical protein
MATSGTPRESSLLPPPRYPDTTPHRTTPSRSGYGSLHGRHLYELRKWRLEGIPSYTASFSSTGLSRVDGALIPRRPNEHDLGNTRMGCTTPSTEPKSRTQHCRRQPCLGRGFSPPSRLQTFLISLAMWPDGPVGLTTCSLMFECGKSNKLCQCPRRCSNRDQLHKIQQVIATSTPKRDGCQ